MKTLAKTASRVLSQPSETPQTAYEKAQYLTAAKTLLGCYRTGDANDPEVYVTAAVRTLSTFPLEVVARVVDPVSGLPGTSKWLPTVSEIREACEAIHGFQERVRQWDVGAAEQIAERQRLEAEREARPSGGDLRQKHGATYGMDPVKSAEDEASERRRVNGDRLAAFTRETILREYHTVGVEPVYSGNVLISPTLLRALGKWPPVGSPA